MGLFGLKWLNEAIVTLTQKSQQPSRSHKQEMQVHMLRRSQIGLKGWSRKYG